MSEQAEQRMRLRLYVAGTTPPSQRAQASLAALTSQLSAAAVELEVIDVIADPQAAERDNVIAAPLLVRLAPGPPLRVIGDLGDHERLRALLGLAPQDPSQKV